MKRIFLISVSLLIISAALVVGYFIGCTTQTNSVWVGDVTQKLPPEMRSFMLATNPWLENAQAIQVGSFLVYGPEDVGEEKLWIYSPKSKRQIFIFPEDIHLTNLGQGMSDMLSLTDQDKDGIFEMLSYETLDTPESKGGSVYDWNRDGQPDLKIVFSGQEDSKPTVSTWLDQQWHEIIKRNDKQGIMVNEKWQEIKKVGHGYEIIK